MTVCSTCKHANYCEIVAGGYSSQVKSCRDYRKGEMTEQEYLQTCTTEQLAEAILQQWIHGAYHGVGEFGLTDKEIESARDGIVEWLKEIHDGNMGRNS